MAIRFNEFYEQQKTIFETVGGLRGLTPANIFEVVDLSTLTESQLFSRFGSPCFAKNAIGESLIETSLQPKIEDSLHKGAEGGGIDGEIVPQKAGEGKDRFKLGNEKVKAVVFSMSPAYECSSERLGMCMSSEACYAKRDEAQYPGVGPARAAQQLYWENATPEQFVEDFMKAAIPSYSKIYGKGKTPEEYKQLTDKKGDDFSHIDPKQMAKFKDREAQMKAGTFKAPKDSEGDEYSGDEYTPNEKLSGKDKVNWLRPMITPIKYFRFNESGDFGSQGDVDKMSKIASMLKEKLGIITYSYTARKDLSFGGVSFNIKGSGYPTLTKNGHCIVFPENEDSPKGYFECAAMKSGVSCLLGCAKCAITNDNVAFKQHSGLGSAVDKVVCDRYKKVYVGEEFVPDGDTIIVKTQKDKLGRTTRLVYCNDFKWKKADMYAKGKDTASLKYTDIVKGKGVKGTGGKSGKVREFVKDSGAMMFVDNTSAMEYIKQTFPDEQVAPLDLQEYLKLEDQRKRDVVTKTKLEPARQTMTKKSVGVRD